MKRFSKGQKSSGPHTQRTHRSVWLRFAPKTTQTVLAVALVSASGPATAADPYLFSYGGRLANSQGEAVRGPVDIEVKFFRTSSGGTSIPVSPLIKRGVILQDGMFQVDLSELTSAEAHLVFSDQQPTWIEIVDVTNRVTYPRQKLSAVPFAFKVPIDRDSVTYDGDGRLTVGTVGMNKVSGLEAALAQKADSGKTYGLNDITGLATALASKAGTNATLAGDVSGTLSATSVNKIQGLSVATPTTSSTYLQYNGTSLVWSAVAGGASGDMNRANNLSDLISPSTARTNLGLGALATASSVTSTNVEDGTLLDADISGNAAIVDSKLATISTVGKVSGSAINSGTIGGTTSLNTSGTISAGTITSSGNIVVNAASGAATELRFGDSDNSNYVGLKAPASVSTNKVWTLPSADGVANQVLKTDGAGNLGWHTVSGGGGGDLFSSNNLSDLPSAETARTNLGLGSLAVASSVTSAHITDGAIVDADINASAAIADTKLGTISTAGKVSGSAITSGTIGGSTIIATSGQLSSTGNIRLAGTGTIATELRFGDNDDSHYVGFKSPATVTTSKIWTLPSTDGSANQILKTDGSGTLGWVSAGPGGDMIAANNLSQLTNMATARTNLGLGNLATESTVTSALIADGTITDTDIASATISDSKLSTISTPGKVSGSAITTGAISGSTSFTGTGGVSTTGMVMSSGNILVNGTGSAPTELRFSDADTSHYLGFKAPMTVATNKIWTLPAGDGTSGQVLSTNGSGVLAWASANQGTGGGAAPSPTSGCPTGYILVPGDTDYGTKDFCVMKYEAKFGDQGAISQALGVPARGNISQDTARASCRDLGPGYALINNKEWMTLASNIANVGGNWSGGSVGSGALNRGHSDYAPGDALAAVTDDNDPCNGTGQTCTSSTWNAQRRTHMLSNGTVVWDLAGNLNEWVGYYNYEDKPMPTGGTWTEYTSVTGSASMAKTSLVPTSILKTWWNNSWNGATNGIGQYYGGFQGSGGALMRGGYWIDGASSGIFTFSLAQSPSTMNTSIGFRCVFRPASP